MKCFAMFVLAIGVAPSSALARDQEQAIVVGKPAEPPAWATAELKAIEAMDAYLTTFLEAYVDEKTGKTVAKFSAGTMDDVAEGFAIWDKFLLVAGSQRLRDAYVKIWQYLYDEAHRRKDFENGFYRRGYDAEHSSELFQLLWGALEMDPTNEKLIKANKQVADCIIDRCYDPKSRLIRTAWLTTSGAREYRDYKQWDYILNTVFIHAAWQAYLTTGDEKYRNWVLEYGTSWNELALANKGVFPYWVDNKTRAIKSPWYTGPGFPYDRWGFTTAARMYHAWPVEMVFLDKGNPKHLSGLVSTIDAMFAHGTKGMPASGIDEKGWSREKYSWHCVKVVDRPYALTFSEKEAQRLKAYIAAIRKHDPKGGEAPYLAWTDFAYFGGGDLDLPTKRFQSIVGSAERRRRGILAGEYDPKVGDDFRAIGLPRLGWEFIDGSWWGLYDNGRCGGASTASVRYFHNENGRTLPGLPKGVAALVRHVAKDHVQLLLYNANAEDTVMVITGGHYAQHRIEEVRETGAKSTEITSRPIVTVTVRPRSLADLRIGLTRSAEPPALPPTPPPAALRMNQCASHLRRLGMALVDHAVEKDDKMPVGDLNPFFDIAKSLGGHVRKAGGTEVFRCPAHSWLPEKGRELCTSYALNISLDEKSNDRWHCPFSLDATGRVRRLGGAAPDTIIAIEMWMKPRKDGTFPNLLKLDDPKWSRLKAGLAPISTYDAEKGATFDENGRLIDPGPYRFLDCYKGTQVPVDRMYHNGKINVLHADGSVEARRIISFTEHGPAKNKIWTRLRD